MRTDVPLPSGRIDRRLLAVNAALLGGAIGVATALSVAGTAAIGLPLGVALGAVLATVIHRALARLAHWSLERDRPIEGTPDARSSDPVAR